MAKTGIDKRYQSIKDIKQPTFTRDNTKNEAEIVPDKGSTIKIKGRKTKFVEENPYEKQIANRMEPVDQADITNGRKATGFPKVTFAA